MEANHSNAQHYTENVISNLCKEGENEKCRVFREILNYCEGGDSLGFKNV